MVENKKIDLILCAVQLLLIREKRRAIEECEKLDITQKEEVQKEKLLHAFVDTAEVLTESIDKEVKKEIGKIRERNRMDVEEYVEMLIR